MYLFIYLFIFQHFEDVTIEVHNINARVLGRELISRCGNEGQWPYNDAVKVTTQKFLQASITHIPLAEKAGANMSNAAFILSQPGNEFVIRSGNGNWEFFFSQNYNGDIYGQCVRKPWHRYFYDKISSAVRYVLSVASGSARMIGYL